MAIQVAKGTFAAATSTGNQAVTGVGFAPEAVILWCDAQTAAGYTGSGATWRLSFGAMTGSGEQFACGWNSQDNVATTVAGRIMDSSAVINVSNGQGRAAWQAFGSDGFTLNWLTAAAAAYVVHYIALGGDDLTDAKAGVFTHTSATGNHSQTVVGFQPDMMLFAGTGTTSAAGFSANANISISATDFTNQWAMAMRSKNGVGVSEVSSAQRTDKLFYSISSSTDTAFLDATVVSADATGWTANYTTAPGSEWGYLALQGTDLAVGSDTQKTTTGTEALTGLGFEPVGLMLFSRGQAAASTIDTTQGRVSIFGATEAAEGGVWVQDVDAADTSQTQSRTVTTKALGFSTADSTTNAEADLTSMDASGFTLDWTTADATAREFLYLAFGPTDSAVNATVTVTAGDVTFEGVNVAVSGSAAVTVTAGDVTFEGVDVTVTSGQFVTVTAGDVTFEGVNVGVVIDGTVVVTPGDVTFEGVNVGVSGSAAVTVTAGDVTFEGVNVGVSGSAAVTVTAGDTTFEGVNVGLVIDSTVAVTPGDVTFEGVTVTVLGTGTSVTVTAGDVTYEGVNVVVFSHPDGGDIIQPRGSHDRRRIRSRRRRWR